MRNYRWGVLSAVEDRFGRFVGQTLPRKYMYAWSKYVLCFVLDRCGNKHRGVCICNHLHV